MRSSSSRATASGQKRVPAAWMPATSDGGAASGAATVISATPRARSIAQATWA